MPELIIPASAKVNYRPYRDATTAALMYELQQRQVIAELAGQIMMPAIELEMAIAAKDELRKQQFLTMAQQMGTAIASSEWALAQITQQPNVMDPLAPPDELLTLKVLLCKHPLREAAMQVAAGGVPERGYQPKADGSDIGE
jgi:hypothetical protein